jgi:hypothetical protein
MWYVLPKVPLQLVTKWADGSLGMRVKRACSMEVIMLTAVVHSYLQKQQLRIPPHVSAGSF